MWKFFPTKPIYCSMQKLLGTKKKSAESKFFKKNGHKLSSMFVKKVFISGLPLQYQDDAIAAWFSSMLYSVLFYSRLYVNILRLVIVSNILVSICSYLNTFLSTSFVLILFCRSKFNLKMISCLDSLLQFLIASFEKEFFKLVPRTFNRIVPNRNNA